jgi:hypothetical protein
MLVFIVLSALILTAAIMLVIRLLRPDFGYHWLIAAVGMVLTWVGILLLGFLLPIRIQIGTWTPDSLLANTFILNLDQISWLFILGIATISLATIFTDVVRARELDWSNWASNLIYSALGFIALLSGNLLTFLLTWTLFDFIGFLILMTQIYSNETRLRLVLILFSRLLGTMSLLLGGVVAVSGREGFMLEQVSTTALVLIVVAALLRIAVLPGEKSLFRSPARRRSMGTVNRMVSAAIIFVFLVRIGFENEFLEMQSTLLTLILLAIGLMALLSGIFWWLAKDESDGQQAWVTGMSAIVIAGAIRGSGEASMAWGLAGLFSGGLLFLASVRERFSLWVALLGLLGISTLPFTPAWNGLSLFVAPFGLYLVLFFLTIILVLLGYALHASQKLDFPVGTERWIKVFYPIGLLVLPLTHFGISWIINPKFGDIPLAGWLLGPLICLLASLGFFWQHRGGRVPQFIVKWIYSLFSLNWLFVFISSVFQLYSRFIKFITAVLEGEGGIIWALLSIVLFLAILVISIGL